MNLRLMFLTSGFLTATALGACSREEFAPWGFPQDLQFDCKNVPTSLPLLVVGQAWEWKLMPVGGKAPLSWDDKDTLPPGLEIDDNGVISGTPTEAGSFPLQITVTDGDGNETLYECATLVVNQPDAPQIDCIDDSGSILDGFVGIPYVFDITAPGGAVPYTWSAMGLPDGLTLVPDANDTTKAQVVGTPTTAGTSMVTITVTDADGNPTTINCGALIISDPISVDTDGLLAAFPDGCVPLGVGLQELLDKKILVGGDDTPITCELRIGRGMGSDKFDGVTETMPPGIKIDNSTSCVVSGPVSPSLAFGIYGFINTYSQSGLDAFVPYCAPQMTQGPDAYQVERTDMGMAASFKPGLQVLDFAANGPVAYGTDVPDPLVTVTDDVGACPNNTCFYAFVYKYNTLSGTAKVSASPNGKFPAMGFDGFTHAVQIDDGDPSLFTRFKDRPFVANVTFDYCISDNDDDCGNSQPNTPEGSAMRAALVRMNGGKSNYYFSLVVLPQN
ncbi:MAG: putative Ig domain-containing protein [Nannocystis sp.]|nr:Ig domain-containing protein [Nannocystis sp.]MBA3547292.1 putative Ig domain-containing protein [Nannocystis sp.]